MNICFYIFITITLSSIHVATLVLLIEVMAQPGNPLKISSPWHFVLHSCMSIGYEVDWMTFNLRVELLRSIQAYLDANPYVFRFYSRHQAGTYLGTVGRYGLKFEMGDWNLHQSTALLHLLFAAKRSSLQGSRDRTNFTQVLYCCIWSSRQFKCQSLTTFESPDRRGSFSGIEVSCKTPHKGDNPSGSSDDMLHKTFSRLFASRVLRPKRFFVFLSLP